MNASKPSLPEATTASTLSMTCPDRYLIAGLSVAAGLLALLSLLPIRDVSLQSDIGGMYRWSWVAVSLLLVIGVWRQRNCLRRHAIYQSMQLVALLMAWVLAAVVVFSDTQVFSTGFYLLWPVLILLGISFNMRMLSSHMVRFAHLPLRHLWSGYAGALLLALLMGSGVGLMAGSPAWPSAILAASAVLLVVCPWLHALARSALLQQMLQRAPAQGVRAAHVPLLAQADMLVFKHTGLLQKGEAVVEHLAPLNNKLKPAAILTLAASIEQHQTDLLAQAIMRAAQTYELETAAVDALQVRPGKGVEGQVDGQHVAVGNEAMMTACGVGLTGPERALGAQIQSQSCTVLWVLAGGDVVGVIGVRRPLDAAHKGALETVREAGIEPVLLSRDARTVLETVAFDVGIENVQPGRVAAAKDAFIKEQVAAGRQVVLVDDHDATGESRKLQLAFVGTAHDAITFDAGDMTPLAALFTMARACRRQSDYYRKYLWFYHGLALFLVCVGLLPWGGWPAAICAWLSLCAGTWIWTRRLRQHRAAMAQRAPTADQG